MIVSDREELEFLASARRGFSPREGDAARVLGALGPALSSTPALAGAAATGPSWTTSLALAAVVAVGAGGYYAGYRAGAAAATPAKTAPVALVAAVPPPPSALSASSATAEPARSQPHSEKPARSAPRSNSSLAGPPSSTEHLDPKLEEETRMVVRVERALRDDNPRFALGLLGELDRAVPGGQLSEEREAARVMAHCQLGTESSAKLAAAFAARHPASAYLGRVKETCTNGSSLPSSQ